MTIVIAGTIYGENMLVTAYKMTPPTVGVTQIIGKNYVKIAQMLSRNYSADCS